MRDHNGTLLAVLALAACSPVTAIAPGTPGAGLRVTIATVTPNSVGYTVTANATNADTTDVIIGACDGSVDALQGGQWIKRTPDVGPCPAYAIVIMPGQTRPITLRDQPVMSGDQIRFTMDWSEEYTRIEGSSTSPTITVQ
ncbi:MAG: hypothetical protein ACREL5_05750 [Gemmatimonadales bacterium]